MTQLTDKVWAVEVPDGSGAFKIMPHFVRNAITERDAIKLVWESEQITHSWVILPPGSWRFLFTTKAATEEQAASVVQIISNGKITGRPQYRRYDRDNELPARMWTRDSRHSLETLLRSKGLDENKNYALIEKL